MKLRVQHEDGRIEILSLSGIWQVRDGAYLNRITDESGFEYFFTHDGHYDGWGGATCLSPSAADEVTQAMEEKREFDG